MSPKAGFACVSQSAVTRCVLTPVACLLIPPACMSILSRLKILPASRPAKIAIELGLIYLSLQGALPAALAVYPQVPLAHSHCSKLLI